MIKLINLTQIEYVEDVLPYIKVVDLPADTIALAEIQYAGGKRSQYLLDNERTMAPITMFETEAPSICLLIVSDSKTFVRTNSVKITDWNKFLNKAMLTPEMKIAQHERRIVDLETPSAKVKPENTMAPVGSVLTLCEGGKQLFKLPYTFSVQVINGKKPNKDGVIEIKLTDMPDLVLVLQGLLDSLNAMNLRIAQVETQVQDLIDPVL